jgi:hypothetical protein
MPIFVEWKWIENTQTLLVVFHFWDNGKENLRTRMRKYDFETVAHVDYNKVAPTSDKDFTSIQTLPEYGLSYPRTDTYMSWAPSHAELCLLTEVLTYANLINGLKPNNRLEVREKLHGRITSHFENGKAYQSIAIHSELLDFMPETSIVSFADQEGVSFEIRMEYVEYLRKLIKPYM